MQVIRPGRKQKGWAKASPSALSLDGPGVRTAVVTAGTDWARREIARRRKNDRLEKVDCCYICLTPLVLVNPEAVDKHICQYCANYEEDEMREETIDRAQGDESDAVLRGVRP